VLLDAGGVVKGGERRRREKKTMMGGYCLNCIDPGMLISLLAADGATD